MPLVLNYRFTFIDAEDDEEAAQGVHLRRALTPPPPRPGQMSHLSEVAHSEELEVARCRDYLNGLMSESGLVDSGDHSAFKQMSDGSKDSNDATVDAPNGASERMSVGSLGHPIACRRPCVHMMKHRQCLNGSPTSAGSRRTKSSLRSVGSFGRSLDSQMLAMWNPARC